MSKNSGGSLKHASGKERSRAPGRFMKMLEQNGFTKLHFDEKELRSRRNRMVGLLILLAGLAVPCGIFGGVQALVLYLATALFYLACLLLLPDIAKPLFWTVAFHMGLAGLRVFNIARWVIDNGFIDMGNVGLNLVDVIIVAGLLVWLVWKPGLWPMSLLLIFDGVTLVSNMPREGDVATGTTLLLIMELAWPVIAALSMYFGLRKLGHFRFRGLGKAFGMGRFNRKEQLAKYVIKAPSEVEKEREQEATRQDPVSKRKRKRRKG